MELRRTLAALAAVATGLVWLTPPAAIAAPGADGAWTGAACRPHAHSAKDSYNHGRPSKGSVPVRSAGPYADCRIDGEIDDSTRLHYHCYTTNDHGNTWTWVRVVGEDIAGWVWDSNLEDNGSAVRC
ncbi:hypothetical protein AB0I60_22335 [Actinosynnema sp. NPDC050436]|uniref:hypothetical protein n=1 Tax=Actinosynnema sp. NPDC050436 TaxID=3155659 RepID=UPI003402582F